MAVDWSSRELREVLVAGLGLLSASASEGASARLIAADLGVLCETVRTATTRGARLDEALDVMPWIADGKHGWPDLDRLLEDATSNTVQGGVAGILSDELISDLMRLSEEVTAAAAGREAAPPAPRPTPEPGDRASTLEITQALGADGGFVVLTVYDMTRHTPPENLARHEWWAPRAWMRTDAAAASEWVADGMKPWPAVSCPADLSQLAALWPPSLRTRTGSAALPLALRLLSGITGLPAHNDQVIAVGAIHDGAFIPLTEQEISARSAALALRGRDILAPSSSGWVRVGPDSRLFLPRRRAHSQLGGRPPLG